MSGAGSLDYTERHLELIGKYQRKIIEERKRAHALLMHLRRVTDERDDLRAEVASARSMIDTLDAELTATRLELNRRAPIAPDGRSPRWEGMV